MSLKRRFLGALLTVVLCLGLLAPIPVSAADLYFTSVNDNLQPLTADTMPVWSGGTLYVPYSVFDSNSTGVKLGLECSYERTSNTVTLYNLRKMLVFDLNTGTTSNELTGETYSAKAIMRNGRPYLPLYLVCDFFGLTYSYNTISQGYLVRIKSSAVVLSDEMFIDAAGDFINRRLREYYQSLNPTPDPGSGGSNTGTTVTPTPVPDDDEDESSATVRTYLAFRCEDAAGTAAVLDSLSEGTYMLFLLTPQVMEEDPGLVRRILGSGHSIGILAQGDSLAQTRTLLEQGNDILDQQLHQRTTIACVPDGHRAALEAEGWVCWKETLALNPSDTVGANTFASNTLRRLNGRTYRTYLTLPANENTARVLSSLLRQLESNDFVVSVPTETHL